MILVLTNADTEILALRSVVEALPPEFPVVQAANPDHLDEAPSLEGVETVLVRLLGGRRAWEQPFDDLRRRCAAASVPLLAFGGEAVPDAELAALSTAPAATVAQAFEYLVHGGLANTEHLLRFVADTVLRGGFGFDPPVDVPAVGVWREPAARPGRPTVGIVFYRAHVISGNTGFVDDLCAALDARGVGAVAVWCYSLRRDPEALRLLAAAAVDAVITTVLAMGAAGDDGEGWDVAALAALDVPVVQAVAATRPREGWESSTAGLSPLDVAMSVAIPEFDGRIVTVPFSFKEVVDDGDVLGSPVTAYRTVPDRVDRVAGVAAHLAALRHVPNPEKRVAVVLSAYPTKRSRIGNAVALDTPTSVIDLLHAMRTAGYRVDRIPPDGDALMAELADGLTLDGAGRWPGGDYAHWFSTLPQVVQDQMTEAWGPPPGEVSTDGDHLTFAGVDLGGVLVAVQPPRGFGDNPIAIYH